MKAALLSCALLCACATGPTMEQHTARAIALFGNDCERAGYPVNSERWQNCVVGNYVRYVDAQRASAAALIASQPPASIVLPQSRLPAYPVCNSLICQ